RVRRLIFLLAFIACKRADVARPDPTPPFDAHKSVPAPTVTSLLALHGCIVDVTTGVVKHPLRDKLPRDETSDGTTAYVLYEDAMLRAWELSSGKPLWSLSTSARTLEA